MEAARFETGDLVIIDGLTSKPELNGCKAHVRGSDPAKGRLVLDLVSGYCRSSCEGEHDGMQISVKFVNCIPSPGRATVHAHALGTDEDEAELVALEELMGVVERAAADRAAAAKGPAARAAEAKAEAKAAALHAEVPRAPATSGDGDVSMEGPDEEKPDEVVARLEHELAKAQARLQGGLQAQARLQAAAQVQQAARATAAAAMAAAAAATGTGAAVRATAAVATATEAVATATEAVATATEALARAMAAAVRATGAAATASDEEEIEEICTPSVAADLRRERRVRERREWGREQGCLGCEGEGCAACEGESEEEEEGEEEEGYSGCSSDSSGTDNLSDGEFPFY